MDKVYLIEYGEYSLYQIIDVYATRELAEQFCNEMNKDIGENSYGYKIKEVDLVTSVPVIKKRLCIIANFDEYGNIVGEVKESYSNHHPGDYVYNREECDFFLYERSYNKPPTYRFSLSDYNHERARKVFSEQQAKLKADIDNGVRPQQQT